MLRVIAPLADVRDDREYYLKPITLRTCMGGSSGRTKSTDLKLGISTSLKACSVQPNL